jgi:MHS family alpha-ketoglutarate permease-like MFS transporter
MTAAAETAAAQDQSTFSRLRSIVSGSAGNLVELYDWFAYASFGLYFAKVFFPKGDQTLQLLNTAAVFAVGFLFRPIGAWLMGLYADRAGRKAAMMLSVAMMCLGSLVIGLTPGYASIGVFAPAILLGARILQGISLGGEYGISATYLSEMAGKDHRGFWSGVLYSTLIGGQLMAISVALLLQAVMPTSELEAWGWRIPFFIGGALALIVLLLRRGMDETPSFKNRSGERASTLLLLARHPRETLIVIGLTAGGTLSYYTYTTYVQKFLVDTSGFSKAAATQITAIGLLVFMLIQPIIGALSDKMGRRPMLVIFGVLGMTGTWPLLSTLARTHDFGAALALVIAAMAVVAFYSSVNAIVKAELFPTEIRALGVALPYSIANALFGGSAEYVALWFKTQGHATWFYTYVTVVVGVSLLVYVFMRDTRKTSRILET